jgi:hypothetical protein
MNTSFMQVGWLTYWRLCEEGFFSLWLWGALNSSAYKYNKNVEEFFKSIYYMNIKIRPSNN